MKGKPERRSVDLGSYPDLVVIYLGFRVRTPRGLIGLFRIGRGLGAILKAGPEGLLTHDYLLFGPLHIGFRQYWRDLQCLEHFTQSAPHKGWWADFLKDSGGAGFWHETYRSQGGMEAIYIDMPKTGFAKFAPPRNPEGPFMSARQRLSPAA
jgi:hypothetical protein